MKRLQRHHAILTALALSCTAPAFGQTTPPDAGRSLRDLQPAPGQLPPRPSTSLAVPADADPQADPGQRFPVQQVRIEGNRGIALEELTPLVAGLAGRDASLGELRQAAGRITALYRQRGFVVARAFVPAQEMQDGVVRIAVLEGSLHATTVVNGSIVHTPVLEGFVAAQRLEGKIIESARTDRELLLLADLPALGAVNGNLKPGREVGSSDLFITVDPGKPYEGNVALDNYGNRYTGQTRLSGSLDINSPARIGDRLSLRGTVTDEQLLYGQVAYDLPVNRNGWRAGATLSASRYDLGQEFSELDASGRARTAGLFSTYPALRGLNANVWLRGQLDYRKLKDEVGATAADTHKTATVALLEAYGDLADPWFGGAYNTWRAGFTSGELDIDTADALAYDRAGPRAQGSYQKYELAATRLQAITPRTSVYAALAAQWAGKNLDSSEKFVLGGMYGVRAYPQGEGVGDSGYLANLELRHNVTAAVEAILFYDHGHVRFNHDPFANGPNEATLKGYGASVGARHQGFNLKATLAWRNGAASQTAPDHSPRLWLLASRSF
ncbi:MAG: ShlB/FhaC/HecB family hemolysin secretion/activation protein [Pseudomonadota bacterium]